MDVGHSTYYNRAPAIRILVLRTYYLESACPVSGVRRACFKFTFSALREVMADDSRYNRQSQFRSYGYVWVIPCRRILH